ncbi:Dehydrogenase orsE [Paramyrothecium foliicola]|nr:Dehydrogenase orsE [Paramyrothecium foliicola]
MTTLNEAAWLLESKALLQVGPAPMHIPGADVVVIKVYSVAINPMEAMIQRLGMMLEEYPAILGADGAGEIYAVGSAVKTFTVGDRVGPHLMEFLLTPKPITDAIPFNDMQLRKPTSWLTFPMTLLSTMPLSYLCASPSRRMPNGQVVLVWGVSSSIGACAIQLLVSAGYEVVAVAGSKNLDECTSLGARYIFDRSSPTAVADILEVLEKKDVAGVFCCVMTDEAVTRSVELFTRLGSSGRLGSIMPPGFPINAPLPDGLDIRRAHGSHIARSELGHFIWGKCLPAVLSNGFLKCSPKPMVFGKGLDQIQGALHKRDTTRSMDIARKSIAASWDCGSDSIASSQTCILTGLACIVVSAMGNGLEGDSDGLKTVWRGLLKTAGFGLAHCPGKFNQNCEKRARRRCLDSSDQPFTINGYWSEKSIDQSPKMANSEKEAPTVSDAKAPGPDVASVKNHQANHTAGKVKDQGIDEAEVEKISQLWHASNAYLVEDCFNSPAFLEAGQGAAEQNDAVPKAIAASLSELRHNHGTILFMTVLASLSVTSIPVVDKYIVSRDGWSHSFLFIAVTTVIHIIAKVATNKYNVKRILIFLKSEESIYWVLFLVPLEILQQYTHLRALESISIPFRSMMRILGTICVAISFESTDRSNLGGLAFLLSALSCILAALVEFFLAFNTALHSSWETGPNKVMFSTALKDEVYTLGAGYLWLCANIFCMIFFYILRSYMSQQFAREEDVIFPTTLLSIPVVLLFSYFLEGWSYDSLERSFPLDARALLAAATIYSGGASIPATYIADQGRKLMRWHTNGMLKAFEIIPLTVLNLCLTIPLLLSSVSDSLLPVMAGFATGLVAFGSCWWKSYTSDPPQTRNWLIGLHNLVAIVTFFLSPAFFASFHRSIVESIYQVPDTVYPLVWQFALGLSFFNVFCVVQGKSRLRSALSILLAVISALSAFFSGPDIFAIGFAVMGSVTYARRTANETRIDERIAMRRKAEVESARPLHPLLPATASPSTSSSASASAAGPITTKSSLARAKPVVTACETCRRSKVKCSGDRPVCRRCRQRKVACHYSLLPGDPTTSKALRQDLKDLRSRATANEEIITLLRNLPDQDAQAVLQRLRSGADVTSLLNHVKAGDVMMQLAVSPETRLRYQVPYGPEMPQSYVIDNPYLKSVLYEATSLYSQNQQATSSLPTNLHPEEYQSLYLKPFHAATVAEPLLTDVKPSLWTTICDDDVLMRDLLRELLHCEYHFTAAFQKDLFLEDMATQNEDFCSSLLVNTALAYACVCHSRFENRAEYWNPQTLLYRFLGEAKRLWELEAADARITTIQTGILFSVIHNLCGLDEIGQPYRIHAVALAQELHLLDGDVGGLTERDKRGRAFAAWALFNWETLVAFSFNIRPTLTAPPTWHLPNPLQDSQWYGEVWVKYPLSHSLAPTYFGQVFKARSLFRVIMNEFCYIHFSEGSQITHTAADGLYLRLTRWYNNLPKSLQPEMIVLPGHLQLHIYYQHLILTMYEPLLDLNPERRVIVQQIITEAKRYLQTLVRLYYLRHGFDAMDLFIVIPCMLTANECVEAINEQTPETELRDLQSTLLLMAKGLYSQRRNHYLAEALFHVIRGRMRQQEISLLMHSMNLNEDEFNRKQSLIQTVRSSWPVTVIKKREEKDAATADTMEAVGAGASIVTFLTVALSTVKILCETLSSVANGPENVKKAASAVLQLRYLLEHIQEDAAARADDATINDVRLCGEDLRVFGAKILDFQALPHDPTRRRLWKRFRAFTDEKELDQFSATVSRHCARLTLRLNLVISQNVFSLKNDVIQSTNVIQSLADSRQEQQAVGFTRHNDLQRMIETKHDDMMSFMQHSQLADQRLFDGMKTQLAGTNASINDLERQLSMSRASHEAAMEDGISAVHTSLKNLQASSISNVQASAMQDTLAQILQHLQLQPLRSSPKEAENNSTSFKSISERIDEAQSPNTSSAEEEVPVPSQRLIQSLRRLGELVRQKEQCFDTFADDSQEGDYILETLSTLLNEAKLYLGDFQTRGLCAKHEAEAAGVNDGLKQLRRGFGQSRFTVNPRNQSLHNKKRPMAVIEQNSSVHEFDLAVGALIIKRRKMAQICNCLDTYEVCILCKSRKLDDTQNPDTFITTEVQVTLLPRDIKSYRMIVATNFVSRLKNGNSVFPISHLAINQLIPNDSKVFQVVSEGRLDELRTMLQNGETSLRYFDEGGASLLFGLDVDHMAIFDELRKTALTADSAIGLTPIEREYLNQCSKMLLGVGADGYLNPDPANDQGFFTKLACYSVNSVSQVKKNIVSTWMLN